MRLPLGSSQMLWPRSEQLCLRHSRMHACLQSWCCIEPHARIAVGACCGAGVGHHRMRVCCCAPAPSQPVNPKEMHVNLVPFLEKNTSLFMKVGPVVIFWGGGGGVTKCEHAMPFVFAFRAPFDHGAFNSMIQCVVKHVSSRTHSP